MTDLQLLGDLRADPPEPGPERPARIEPRPTARRATARRTSQIPRPALGRRLGVTAVGLLVSAVTLLATALVDLLG